MTLWMEIHRQQDDLLHEAAAKPVTQSWGAFHLRSWWSLCIGKKNISMVRANLQYFHRLFFLLSMVNRLYQLRPLKPLIKKSRRWSIAPLRYSIPVQGIEHGKAENLISPLVNLCSERDAVQQESAPIKHALATVKCCDFKDGRLLHDKNEKKWINIADITDSRRRKWMFENAASLRASGQSSRVI